MIPPAFPLPRAARIAVFASGRGSNLASLLAAFPPDGALGRVVQVVVNVPGAAAVDRATAAGVPAATLPWTRDRGDRAGFEREAQRILDQAGVDLVCLAGFMRILSPGFVERWQGRILNVHPSLLPAHRGLHPQRRALEAGDAESGCTVHRVDAGVDTGEIVLQRRVPILAGDDEATLSARILAEEHRAYPDAVRTLLRGGTS
jgi:phosphoribosylglycinamide formyltransferase-1